MTIEVPQAIAENYLFKPHPLFLIIRESQALEKGILLNTHIPVFHHTYI